MIKFFTFINLLIFPIISYSSVLSGELESNYAVAYLNNSASGYSNPDWMSNISDNSLISELSIPGTHQSLSRHGGDEVATQSLTIADQLSTGVRYFDVGFKYVDDDLYAFDTKIHQGETFANFLNDISIFLESYPSETVIIRVRNRSNNLDEKNAFYQAFLKITKEHKDKHFIPKTNNFYLGDARGKFVFINDIGLKNKIGMSMNSMFIQNDNRVDLKNDLFSKWEKVKQHLIELEDIKLQYPVISLNYLAGVGSISPYFIASGKVKSDTHAPQEIADDIATNNADELPDFPRVNCEDDLCNLQYLGVNQLLFNWISTQRFNTNLGIIVADFPGGALIQAIIKNNQGILSKDQ